METNLQRNLEKLSYSMEEASEATGLPAEAIRKAVARGELPARKHLRRVVILRDELESFLAKLPERTTTHA